MKNWIPKIGDKIKIPNLTVKNYNNFLDLENTTAYEVAIRNNRDYFTVSTVDGNKISVCGFDINSQKESHFNLEDLSPYELPAEYIVYIENAEDRSKTDKFVSFYNGTYGANVGGHDDYYYRVPYDKTCSHKCVECNLEDIGDYKTLPVFTLEEWLSCQSVEKDELTGFKLIKDIPYHKAGEILIPNGHQRWLLKGSLLNTDNHYINNEPLNLPDWFEPIYAPKIKTSTLTLGNPAKSIIIDSQGHIICKVGNTEYPFTKHSLEELIKKFRFSACILPGTNLNSKMNSIWVGCNEGTALTIEDIETVEKEFKNLNPGLYK